MSSALWHDAIPTDEAALLALMAAFYEEERLAFDLLRTRGLVRQMIATADLGQIFVLREGEAVGGCMVLTFGFSLEFGGRFALLDELYIAPAWRGKGFGRHALERAEGWTRAQGVAALRLEISDANTHARRLYLKAGFVADARALFTRAL